MNTANSYRRPRQSERRGNITVLAAFLSIVMIGMMAFTVDVGYVLSVKEEMQRTADAAALAACWEYVEELSQDHSAIDCALAARAVAADCASDNVIANVSPTIGSNYSNSPSGDLVFGYVPDLYAGTANLDTSDPARFNVVKIKVRRDGTLNGKAPLFFARVFGLTSQSLIAEASAGVVRDVKGFKAPANGGNIDLLPFTLDLDTHTAWMGGAGADDWSYDPDTGAITPGPDGKPEVSLYPQGTGSPGNRGTVDIGGSNNSTSDLARQILSGISPGDLQNLGKPLTLDSTGELTLNGDTGISAGIKDELAAIKGEARAIPIFRDVSGPGNNAMYTIVSWQGIRIMDVKLTGPMKKKHVTIQMGPVLTKGVVPATTAGTSNHIYSHTVLID